MSEIIFKAIRVRTGAWVDCSPTIRNSEVFSNHKELGVVNSYLIDTDTLCQFTGSRDCNGFPIYEHDLLRCEKTGSIYEVVWNQGNTSFSFVNTECPVLYPNTLGSILRNSRLKVIGNKFDKKGGKQ
jgi:hypothetical protein